MARAMFCVCCSSRVGLLMFSSSWLAKVSSACMLALARSSAAAWCCSASSTRRSSSCCLGSFASSFFDSGSTFFSAVSSFFSALSWGLPPTISARSRVVGAFLTSSFFTGSADFVSSLASLLAWCTSCFCSALACAWLRWKACACLRSALAWSIACAREASSAPDCSSMSSIAGSSTCSTRPNWRSTSPSACSERCSMLSPTFSLACSEASACCS
mmetsp:Transcript_12091/g.31032  ORF Transcript_12091/g.31032 Transcript_12091/m.31032 type:complete len:215 (-) Transcript_12091:688-1332(-)